MTYVTNEAKHTNNTLKADAQFKHYNSLAKANYTRKPSSVATPRGSVNGNH